MSKYFSMFGNFLRKKLSAFHLNYERNHVYIYMYVPCNLLLDSCMHKWSHLLIISGSYTEEMRNTSTPRLYGCDSVIPTNGLWNKCVNLRLCVFSRRTTYVQLFNVAKTDYIFKERERGVEFSKSSPSAGQDTS